MHPIVHYSITFSTIQHFPLSLYPGGGDQFLPAIVDEGGYAVPGTLQMELEGKHMVLVEKALIGTGLAGIKADGIVGQRKGIAVPVEDGEFLRQDRANGLGYRGRSEHWKPTDLLLRIGPDFGPQSIRQELSSRQIPRTGVLRAITFPRKAFSSRSQGYSTWS